MTLRVFYIVILSVLITVTGLSLAWEFLLEDLILPHIVSYHEAEDLGQRWEFVVSVAAFSAIALVAPTVIGSILIRRDRALQETMIRLSREDHLTGLFNRRWISQLLANEIRRASRYETEFSLILVDIDDFKVINDKFGHQTGDSFLVEIVEIIRSRVRATDLVGRWGGEEFLIISPETDIDGAATLAEKIRSRLELADFGEIGRKTASFGVTAYASGDDNECIIERADRGLYAAKRGGKNRVESVPAGIGVRANNSATF